MIKIHNLFFLAAGVVCTAPAVADPPRRPNIILIVADDLGWSDVGFNGCREIPTPNLDAIASSGVVFTSGYASHPYCSPSRAGLLAGRYQQRFGHECNPGAAGQRSDAGLPLSERLLPELLQSGGYRTAAIGKWHLGDAEHFWPSRRGFDHWFGFSGGGMSYWGSVGTKGPKSGVLRNGAVVPKSELTHLTDDFSSEAVRYVEQNHDAPFFLYLAYNAPHAPDHATREHLRKTEHIEYGGRAVYGAMVAGMDEGIGRIANALKKLKLYDDTLIFFYSDNGGRTEHARNFPFRGHKGMLFEGGVRVPFCCSWPRRIGRDKRYDEAVSALDIFPTALAAAGVQPPSDLSLDGVNLLPYLSGNVSESPHQTLYWRYACGDGEFGYAVRDGNYKLVDSVYKGKKLLFDLQTDPWERQDLAEQQPETVERLTRLIQRWDEQNMPPRWLDPHGANVRKEEAARQEAIDAASRGEPDRG